MKRRHFITAAGVAPFVSLSGQQAYAQVSDLSDAINKAGRQRMLSQRMSKAWLALVKRFHSGQETKKERRSLALPGHSSSCRRRV